MTFFQVWKEKKQAECRENDVEIRFVANFISPKKHLPRVKKNHTVLESYLGIFH